MQAVGIRIQKEGNMSSIPKPLDHVVSDVINSVIKNRTGDLVTEMGYIELIGMCCSIVEQISKRFLISKSEKKLGSAEKLDLACDVVEIVVDLLKDTPIPGKNRNILLPEDVAFIESLTGEEMKKTVNGILSVINSADMFGDFEGLSEISDRVVKSGCLCWDFWKKKKKQ